MAEDYDFLFKSVIVGDGGSGKTAVVVRFSQGFFQENYKLTIGVEFAVKTININNNKVKLQIWDTGGQERFRYVRPLYYKGSMGCIILFDLTNRESFDHVPKWLEEVKKEAGNIPILLVGNKSDLVAERKVSIDEAKQIANDLNMFYVESSAKSGKGVGDIFAMLSLLMIGEDIPPEMLKTSLPTEINNSENIEKKESPSFPKPKPISTSVVKPASMPKPKNLQISNDQKEPDWFAPAVSPKPEPIPEPNPFITPEPIPEPKPEPNPFITPELIPKPEPNPFITPEPIPKPEPNPFIIPEPKKSEINNFFIPEVPKKKPLVQNNQKISGSSIKSNPFLTQNREPILPKSNFPMKKSSFNKNMELTKDSSKKTNLFDTLINDDDSKSQPIKNNTWGFMSNITKPSKPEIKNNLTFESLKHETVSKPQKDSKKIKIKCPHCGALVNKHFKFCNKCGNRI
ncbi:MAG: GTP-binding protein [Promethearchaeota archaeon]